MHKEPNSIRKTVTDTLSAQPIQTLSRHSRILENTNIPLGGNIMNCIGRYYLYTHKL